MNNTTCIIWELFENIQQSLMCLRVALNLILDLFGGFERVVLARCFFPNGFVYNSCVSLRFQDKKRSHLPRSAITSQNQDRNKLVVNRIQQLPQLPITKNMLPQF